MSTPANNLKTGAATTGDLSDGIYVQGSVGNVPVMFAADTGAARSVLSHEVYQKIKDGERPTLRGYVGLRRAGGTEIRERSRGIFNLTMGPVTMEKEMVVADIEDDALLGCDVLAGSKAGSADILLSEEVIILEGKESPCMLKVGHESARKVLVEDNVTLPDKTEAFRDVYLERSRDDGLYEESYRLEQKTDAFKQKLQMAEASTLADVNRTTTNQVKVVNPYMTEMSMKQGADMGMTEKVNSVVNIISEKGHEAEESTDSKSHQTKATFVHWSRNALSAETEKPAAATVTAPNRIQHVGYGLNERAKALEVSSAFGQWSGESTSEKASGKGGHKHQKRRTTKTAVTSCNDHRISLENGHSPHDEDHRYRSGRAKRSKREVLSDSSEIKEAVAKVANIAFKNLNWHC